MSNAVTETKSFAASGKHILRLSLSLLIISTVAALILAVVNTLTATPIAEYAAAKRQQAMESVMPGATVFSELYAEDETIIGITGAYNGTQFKGYCVEVSPNGFGGPIRMMVGVDYGGAVTGTVILEHSETAGLGAKAKEPEFLNQYIDMSGTITVTNGSNAIDAITGATITSKAVTNGINTALEAVLNYNEEGGLPDDKDEV